MRNFTLFIVVIACALFVKYLSFRSNESKILPPKDERYYFTRFDYTKKHHSNCDNKVDNCLKLKKAYKLISEIELASNDVKNLIKDLNSSYSTYGFVKNFSDTDILDDELFFDENGDNLSANMGKEGLIRSITFGYQKEFKTNGRYKDKIIKCATLKIHSKNGKIPAYLSIVNGLDYDSKFCELLLLSSGVYNLKFKLDNKEINGFVFGKW